jgi:subtilisin family serine protease
LEINTEESPQFIGAPTIWNQLGGQGSAGEGVIVGVIDTGIWPEHPSFSDPDPSGKPYAAPPGGPYACDFGNTGWNANDAPFTCNNKLIGAYEFMDTYKLAVGLDPLEFDSARDSDGHGSHTSSTAAGNWGVAASILGTYFGDVSGVAPRAHIIMYRVCGGATGSCYSSDSVAAIDQAILDGVDVLNFSIGGGETPYSDIVSLAFLSAYENGIFVAASAGNDGPGEDTVGHREPWVTTAAASTQSRTFLGDIHLVADNSDALHLQGVSIGGSATGEVVVGADYGNALCGSVEGVNPFPAGTFTSDQIVVCARGITARVEKSWNVQQGGAGGMILYNPSINSLNADNHFVPTCISAIPMRDLLSFCSPHSGVDGTLTARKAMNRVMSWASARAAVPASPWASASLTSQPRVSTSWQRTPR